MVAAPTVAAAMSKEPQTREATRHVRLFTFMSNLSFVRRLSGRRVVDMR
jgi:hypothetical protein